jgi:hypothetical protein
MQAARSTAKIRRASADVAERRGGCLSCWHALSANEPVTATPDAMGINGRLVQFLIPSTRRFVCGNPSLNVLLQQIHR